MDRYSVESCSSMRHHHGGGRGNVVVSTIDVGDISRLGVEGQRQLVLARPGFGGEQLDGDGEEAAGRADGHRRLGALRGLQQRGRRNQPLVCIDEERHRLAQVGGEVDQRLRDLGSTRVGQQRRLATVIGAALRLVQRVERRLANSVVQELVTGIERRGPDSDELGLVEDVAVLIVERSHQLLGERFVECSCRRHRVSPREPADRGQRKARPDHRSGLQRLERWRRQHVQPRRQQVGHVVGDRTRRDGVPTPDPCVRRSVVGQCAIAVQRLEELPNEEGVAAGLVVRDPTERAGLLVVLAQSIRDDSLDVVPIEWRQLQDRCGHLGVVELAQQRPNGVIRSDLVLAPCSQHEERDRTSVGEQHFQQGQRGQVGPLEVVEEYRQRSAGRRNGANQVRDGQGQPSTCFRRRHRRRFGLLTEERRQIRTKRDQRGSTRAQGRIQLGPQRSQL